MLANKLSAYFLESRKDVDANIGGTFGIQLGDESTQTVGSEGQQERKLLGRRSCWARGEGGVANRE
jgi:hypothetical protein